MNRLHTFPALSLLASETEEEDGGMDGGGGPDSVCVSMCECVCVLGVKAEVKAEVWDAFCRSDVCQSAAPGGSFPPAESWHAVPTRRR